MLTFANGMKKKTSRKNHREKVFRQLTIPVRLLGGYATNSAELVHFEMLLVKSLISSVD